MASGLFDSLMGGPSSANGSPAVAYSNVRLMEQSSIDLYIHNSRGKGIFSYDAWLEEGRPRQLSSLNISTWSLLTTSIKEYQLGLRQYARRIYARLILPIYFLWFLSLFVPAFDEMAEQRADKYMLISLLMLVGMILLSVVVSSHFQQRHVDQIFNPAVQSVLEELRPKLTESGWDVVLMVETGQYCVKPTKSFLRFAPLPDEEKVAHEQQQQP